MDSNQNSQPAAPVSPEQRNGHKMAYIIVGIFSLVVLAAVAVPFTLNIFNSGNQEMIDKQEIAEDTQTLNEFRQNSSIEGQQAYIKSVDARLADNNVSDAARDLLLLRKALVMSNARGDEATIKSNVAAATLVLKDFINRTDAEAAYFKDFSLVALTRLQLQCCSVSTNLMDGSIPLFDTYERYTGMGYSPSLSALLTLDDGTTKLSEARKIDAMNRLNSVDLAAKILIGYADQLKPDTKSRLLQELNGALNEFPSLKPLTYNDVVVITYEAGNKLALAYDLYHSNQANGSSASVNSAIDRQYEDAADSIRAAMKVATDIHGLNEVLFYNQINYLESIDRRYGDAVNQEKKDAAIATILNILKTEPTITNVGHLYFRGAQAWKQSNPDELKKITAYTHFMDQSKTNSEVAAYLKSIGVTW